MTLKCRICGLESNHPVYEIQEMMFGTRERFRYFQCNGCDCLQILSIPQDLNKYYPSEYYSFNIRPPIRRDHRIKRWMRTQRCAAAIFGRRRILEPILWRFVDRPKELGPFEGGAPISDVIRACAIESFNAEFLDVGCGSYSHWLASLSYLGFKNLYGVDPLIRIDVERDNVKIFRRELEAMTGHFDLITLHHSLEHMPSQWDVLRSIRSLLKPRGTCLIRIPLVSSLVWEKYGVNWVELDAPRHLYLHSTNSIKLLANSVGLELYKVVYDSLPFEFYGSEQYSRDIPLTDPRSFWINPGSPLFSPEERKKFELTAARVNADQRGGRAGFYFRPMA